jgi:isoleucyl-tRNA synthetase
MAKVPFFDSVDPKAPFPEMEKALLDVWTKNKIQDKYRSKNKDSKKIFSFLDGPITANNPMGVHHAWGRTYKDLWQRYKNMQGYKQRFQNGFDCQGLWVEVEVEKELGLKSKKDIENLVAGDKKASIAKFVELCKERAQKYADVQTEQSKRLGYFMDWDNSYYTMSDENNYMIWHFLKKCHEEGLIYKGHDVVPWCPRCETAISQHEILTEDYKELTHDSVFVAFPIVEREDERLLIWTTTPWTIPANTAVAVDVSLDYVLVESFDKKYWIAKTLLETVFKDKEKKVVKTVKGKELVGLKYVSPFDDLPAIAQAIKETPEKIHLVIATDNLLMPISTLEGTGLVHTSTSTGEEDFKVGKLRGLVVIPAINDTAEYLDGFGELTGANAKKHPEIIIEKLKEKGFLFDTLRYTHRYPACWRCKTELVWKVADEWYIAMDTSLKETGKTLREMMVEVVKKIKWLPEFGLERELDWLKNMHDWLISKKNRYWGLALPIWECKDCHEFSVLGSFDELKEKAVEGFDKFEGHTPHKPWIDEVKVKCDKCGKAADRVLDVGNPWLDAGIVSFSTVSSDNKSEPLYKTDKVEFAKWYPAEFITESFPGQFKNWFYSLIAMSTVLENKEPFKNVLGFATLFGEDGMPMHKSSGNAVSFDEGADKIGVDVMRWMFVRQNPADNLLFGYHLSDEVRRHFHLMLWNIYNFFVTYANLDGWQPEPVLAFNSQSFAVLDKWILSRLTQTAGEVTKALEGYDAMTASGEIDAFVSDLSLWYIRRSRDRVGPAAENGADKNAFYQTTHYVLVTFSRLLAPFMPFLSEVIFQNLTKGESVHLTDWPEIKSEVDQKLISDMAHLREVVEGAHAIRKEAKIAVRVPLLRLKTKYPYELPEESIKKYLLEEVNVKNWEIVKGEVLENELDRTTTPELEEEAKTRELMRAVQDERKKMGLALTDKIIIENDWLPGAAENIERLKKKTVASEIKNGSFKVTKV